MPKNFSVGYPCKFNSSSDTFLGRVVEKINSLFHFATPHGSLFLEVNLDNLEHISNQEFQELLCFEGDASLVGPFYAQKLVTERIIQGNELFKQNT